MFISEQALQVFEKALRDAEFMSALVDDSSSNPLGHLNKTRDHYLLASTYYGYLRGKYGKEWRKFL